MTICDTAGDAELVNMARTGSEAALAALYRAHAGAVAVAIRRKVGDRDVVADLVQETFARALERLATLRDPHRFKPWLLAIARNAAVDQRRRRRRLMLTAADRATREDADPTGQPDEHAEAIELATLVDSCVASLSERDARALAMVTHLGLGPARVAVVLGVTPGAAKVIVHRARARFRSALALAVFGRRGGEGCTEFEALRQAAAPAGRHVRDCAECWKLARQEVAGRCG
jgi:RNA polymerase sigma-70 factor (ECF subfamily)